VDRGTSQGALIVGDDKFGVRVFMVEGGVCPIEARMSVAKPALSEPANIQGQMNLSHYVI
jgi:hypothetical protein